MRNREGFLPPKITTFIFCFAADEHQKDQIRKTDVGRNCANWGLSELKAIFSNTTIRSI